MGQELSSLAPSNWHPPSFFPFKFVSRKVRKGFKDEGVAGRGIGQSGWQGRAWGQGGRNDPSLVCTYE
jgi:hypothetical protein